MAYLFSCLFISCFVSRQQQEKQPFGSYLDHPHYHPYPHLTFFCFFPLLLPPGIWERPAWAKGGVKLRSTGFGDAMKTEGNLAAPITFTPFKNEDHKNYVANPEILASTDVGEKMKTKGDLAMPITNIRDEIRKQRTSSSSR
jgi:hypothetical protein